ncbi:NAD-dependent epimerase/dehydratase family protein [Streptomyces sp. WAC05374]|uniref:SDR family oxidoreductase n=1 Tax=Streptomyces sp. WAC05374 TaxID=2487420 RepID=UPI000F881820|nr:SDR family oxidoreductase [Streptomyces sp. WAC05374]RST19677.1 NAD-dependent epimerase/dehydratase family protein [Streptomyces sp. WAC05374]TDF57712.1 NAD-dependent epimerase/dehydratase family protein [Streptomyces sp. WAC05374]TDF60240.1 NAD-dependent epimerase/dehydratase family protein [Streptomyces sp. WAC05374]
MRRTILLTGASGVVGSAVLRALDGTPVIALTHRRPVTGKALHGDVTRPWLGMSPADYRELATTVDVVIHCAALVNFGASAHSLHRVNVNGVGQILRFVEDAGARLVHGSTAFVARAGADTALTAYARSKAAGETLVRESGLPSVIARISTVIGDSRTGEIARLQTFHYLIGSVMAGQLPFLPCSHRTRIDMVPTDVIAAALVALARDESAGGDHWITAGPAGVPMRQIIDLGHQEVLARRQHIPALPKVDLDLLRPRLIDPDVHDGVVSSVLESGTGSSASITRHLTGLMAIYNGWEPFPTSLGTMKDGPPALTEASARRALRATLHRLVRMPAETWDITR